MRIAFACNSTNCRVWFPRRRIRPRSRMPLPSKTFPLCFAKRSCLKLETPRVSRENTPTKNWFGTMEGSDLTPKRSISVLKFCSLFPWIMKGRRYPFGCSQEPPKREERSTMRIFRPRFFCEKGKESGGSPP